MAQDTPGFIAASLVDLETGLMMAEYSRDSEFDLASASGLVGAQVAQQLVTLRELDLPSQFEDIMVVLPTQVHLIVQVSESVFAFLVANRRVAGIGLLRTMLQKRKSQLLECLGAV